MASPTGNLLDYIRANPNFNQRNSINWFMRNVRDLGFAVNYGPMKMLGDNLSRQVSTPTVGKMLMFTYSPKHKETLPFYDTFPLVIPFSVTPTHFTGINFHYLFPRVRLSLLNHLLTYANDDTMDANKKILLTWDLLKRAGKTVDCSRAVKQYLLSHVMSRFVEVAPVDWVSVIHLPLERFKKAQNSTVWLKSGTP